MKKTTLKHDIGKITSDPSYSLLNEARVRFFDFFAFSKPQTLNSLFELSLQPQLRLFIL
jgi:hypothetical protein